MKVYLFEVTTILAAVGVAAAVGGTASGSKANKKAAKAGINQKEREVKDERVASARELRDEEKATEQEVARIKAISAAGGGSLSDVGTRSLLQRTIKESEIREARIEKDSDARVRSLVVEAKDIARQSKSAQQAGLFGGVLRGAAAAGGGF